MSAVEPVGAAGAVPPRRVDLEGCYNFRDLGGYGTADGGTVRHGLVFRTDSLHRASEADWAVLLAEVGLRAAIDLRADDERETLGLVGDERGLVLHHLPAIDRAMHATRDEAATVTGEPAQFSMGELYVSMLERGAQAFTGAIELIADAELHPIAFYCSAGKDRTGILAAVVLSLVGVEPEVVVGDYAATQERIELIRARSRQENPAGAAVWDATPAVTQAWPESMAQTLELVDRRWGGFGGWAEAHGVHPDTLTRLRASLVAR